MSPCSVFLTVIRDKKAYLKCSPVKLNGTSFDVFVEKEKYDFLSGKLIIPEIIEIDQTENFRFMLMTALEGEELLDIAISKDLNKYLYYLRLGLDVLKNIKDCPFLNSLSYIFSEYDFLIKNGFFNPDISKYEALKNNPINEVLVPSHGDIRNLICSGTDVGFIDVGKFGLADQHYDLAVAVSEIKKHFSSESANVFLNSMPFKIDLDKLDYFTRLNDL